MVQEEIVGEKFRPTIKPTVELREALEEIEKSRRFFKEAGFIDYLHSVNYYYLEKKGKIVGPLSQISGILNNNDESDILELDERSRGGIEIYLECEEKKEALIDKKRIYIGLKYNKEYDYFTLILYASRGEGSVESSISNSRFKQKTFYLNSYQNTLERMREDVDNLLLTFTSELLGAKIL